MRHLAFNVHRPLARVLPAPCLWLAANAAAAPEKSAAPAVALGVGNVVQLMLGLVVVLLIVAGLAWLMRRVVRIQSSVGGGLQVLGGLSMGARERVVLVRVGERQLLLGVAPGRVTTLHVLEEPLREQSPEAGPEAGFAANLRAALKGVRR